MTTAAARPKKRRLALHWKIIIGLVLGVIVGLIVNQAWTDQTWASMGVNDPGAYLGGGAGALEAVPSGVDTAGLTEEELLARYPNLNDTWLAETARFVRNATEFVGDLFLRGLRFIAVPIVLFSLIVGASSVREIAKLGRIGLKTVVFYLATTAIAITVGLLLANIVGPGRGFDETLRDQLAAENAVDAQSRIESAAAPDVWQTVLDIVPANPFQAIAAGNMLPVVFSALLVGIALTMIDPKKSKVAQTFFDAMTDVIIRIVHWVLIIAPYAVFALITIVIADLGTSVLLQLVKYSLVVVTGLAVMIFGVYPAALYAFGTKVSYARFFRAISPAQLLAFSSASSSATLPVTLECAIDRLGVSDEVASFVLPVGATVNMDGTALYQGVAAVFIAQIYALDLTIGQQLTIVLTATLASIGTAGVPGVGMIMLVIVLQAVGIPLQGIAVILGVDRILDMCRTVCNVTGDLAVCSVIAASENELLTEDELAARLERDGLPVEEATG